MKTSKKIISLVLCAVMVASTFLSIGPIVSFKSEAAEGDVTLGGITQKRVVSNYESEYRKYQKRFFNGEETNWPTDFVIPGLSDADDYTPQGMTYWKAKEWILISAYDASGAGEPSVIYALDVVTTKMVAVFKIQNADGTNNTSHGGGIAASEYNFYYADSGSKISYVPLSEMDVAPNTTKTIKLKDSIDLSAEMTGAETNQTVKTSYCCYDDGVLWTGNFQWTSDSYNYNEKYHEAYMSVLMGYKLAGNSSAEEWYYLKHGYNLVKLDKNSMTDDQGDGTVTYKAYNVDGANAEIRGKVTTDVALGEKTAYFCSLNLTEGKQYKVEFIADNNLTDMYFFAPNGGGHCNVKQSQASKITSLGDGRYHYQMIFTAGLKPDGADSSWPTTQSTNGTYTGKYTMRFDQDSVPAGGRSFNITDFSVSEYTNVTGFTPDSKYEGIGCQGNPTYVIAMDTDRIQYAMVDKGKLYVSRSWSRTDSGNHTRELMIADIDLNAPGNVTYTVNGMDKQIHLVDYANAIHFGGNFKSTDHGVSLEERNRMLFMGEALCVINDYLYMFGESAAWTYNGKDSSSVCPEPIDVLWKIDQYAIQGLKRTHEDVAAAEYEKVTSLSEINNVDEYIVLYESPFKDPVTQDNILYLLDSYGGYDGRKLPKRTSPNSEDVAAKSTGDSRGIVGYEIRDYSVKTENGKTSIILSAEDDANKSLHWQFESGSSTSLQLRNSDLYFTKNPYLYIGDSLLAMTTNPSSTMKIKDWGNGDFTIYGSGENYSLWCNDGEVADSITKYTNFYKNHGQSGFVPNYHGLAEVPGTFHVTNDSQPATPSNEQQGLHIYKRVTDPYASSFETQVYTDLQAELTSDGTYNITLETYATNALQYQRVDERPTDFIFVIDSSGSMDARDAQGYNTEDGWSDLKQNQICVQYTSSSDTVSNSHFEKGSNYNTAHISKFFYKLPDGQFGRIGFAFNGLDTGDPTYGRDFWMWVEHPETGRCYRLSKLGFLTYGNFSGDAGTQDNNHRLKESDYLANPQNYGWANRDAVMSDVVNNQNRTDYISDSYWDYGSTSKRANYAVLNIKYTNDSGVQKNTYYTYGSCQRILGVKQALDKLVVKIQNEAARTGLDHRIALVSSASDDKDQNYLWTNTGMYTNNGTTMTQYTGENSIPATTYKNAFFSTSQFGTVRTIIDNMYPLGHTFLHHGLTMANNIVTNSDYKYDINGTRSAVVVVISDGAAGGDALAYANITNSNEAANGAIGNGGLKLKRSGAYIFSVQVGTATGDYKVSGFEEADFMKYLSSNYNGAKSMTDPGPFNDKGNNYYINIPVGTSFNIDTVANSIFDGVVANSNNAISYLNTNSILREHLTDSFDLTNASISYQTAQSKYDGIGRLYFEAPVAASGFTTSFDKTTNNIEVKGFDYTENNVSEYNSKKGNGKKLIVTISGVIAKHDEELLNTSINDTSKTALYQNATYMSSNQPVKRFPTYHFSIPEYTYYLDYGIPMYDSDINGTLCSVDSTLQKQSTYRTELSTGNMGIQFTNSNQDMVYTLNSQAGLTENLSKGYVLIKRDDGTYDWFRLNIVPASTVYYEENKADTLDGTQSFTEWTQSGSPDSYSQALSGKNDVFGSDSTYSQNRDTFSLGTHKEVTVSPSANRSDTQTFTFTGTGFDLYSACGTNTGIQTVTVKQHQSDGTMKIVKVFMVDTFYNDSTYGTLYQVPIVHYVCDYGTYTVETTAAYFSFAGGIKTQSTGTLEIEGTEIEATSAVADIPSTDALFAQVGMDELIGQEVEVIWMDENSVLNGGTGAGRFNFATQDTTDQEKSLVNYLDGFRIYNAEKYNDEYIANEQNATYYSVIDAITAGGMSGDSFAGYLEGGETGSVFGDYLTSGGPKYEVYLKPGNSIAFRFKATFGSALPRAMVSVRSASGEAKAKFSNTTPEGSPYHNVSHETGVLGSSETFFDITDNALGLDANDGSFILTVTNTGSGLLAVDNIKLTNATLQPFSDVSLESLNVLISTQAVEIETGTFSVETPEEPTFVDAPSDNPHIDPVGRIPTLEEYTEQKAEEEENKQTFFEMIIELFKTIIERIRIDLFTTIIECIKEVLKTLPALRTAIN